MSGLHRMQQRYVRPGVPEQLAEMVRTPQASQAVPFQEMPMDEFDKRLAENYALGPSSEGYDALAAKKGAGG